MRAFEALVEKYDRYVLNIAYSFRNSQDDAKDIYQEVFMRVYRGLKKFRYDSEFSTWLYRITTNVCITYYKKMKRHSHDSLDRDIVENEGDNRTVSDILPSSVRTEDKAVGSDISGHINRALGELPAQQKLAFTLKFYDGFKIREIADMMNCAEGTVKRYIFNATNKMREQLKGLAYE